MRLYAEVSPGELLDKISILEIKRERIRDEHKLNHIQLELDVLKEVWSNHLPPSSRLSHLYHELKALNEKLWDIEDGIRSCERRRVFDDKFVDLARSVYQTNDRRSAVKRGINELLGARIMEEKSYEPY
ncbi:MAG: DUF6165 family protein [Deltaproteobacteria bacterium]|nr:DUF6165 family protein [Deltaproteobacteria bacterium]MCF8119985.1 DUF6165 family protein [Deltaproteobacteria bacterium]